MSRTRASAKAAGTRTESAAVAYLQQHVSDLIERRRLTGARDRGDLSGLRIYGQRLVAEVKDHAQLKVGPWLEEAAAERDNDSALAGVVIAKRVGKGQPQDMVVFMTLRDFAALLSGVAPEDGAA